MDLKAYLKSRKEKTDAFLLDYVGGLDIPARLKESMTYSLAAGGKRVRPVLVFAGHEAMGGKNDDAAVAAGAVLEMIHTYSLIHDDLPAMDNDDFRRGKPTNHKVFGDAVAILAGDALLTQAFELLTDETRMAPVSPETRLRIISEIASAAGSSGMVGGQVIDILSEGAEIAPETLEDMHLRKTGALISASVVVGGLLGEARASRLEALRRYGRNIGLAFQVADDILDVTASAEDLGKSTSDLARGKKTYPAIHGLSKAQELADHLVQESLSCLASFGPAADPLREIARYIVARTH